MLWVCMFLLIWEKMVGLNMREGGGKRQEGRGRREGS